MVDAVVDDMLPVEVDDVKNSPPGGPEEVVEAVLVEVELTESLLVLDPSVGSQSSGPGGAVVEETPVEVEDVKN